MSSQRVPQRWWSLPVALAAALVISACGSSDTDSVRATTTTRPSSRSGAEATPLSTGFEKGTTVGFTDAFGAHVTHEAAKRGAFGLDLSSVSSDAYLRWRAEPADHPLPFWSFRTWVRVMAWSPAESVDLFTVRNLQVKNNFDLFVGAPERAFQWDLFRENSAAAPAPVELGRWYLVEARGSFASSTSTAEVRIDGVIQPSIASTGQQPSAVKEVIIGSIGTMKTNRVQVDDVRIELADHPLELLGPPAAVPQ